MISYHKSPDMTQATTEQLRASAIRASLACVPCRSRHLRCGAEKPRCDRCQRDDTACVYLKSRRGGNRRRPAAPGQILDHGSNSPPQTYPPPASNKAETQLVVVGETRIDTFNISPPAASETSNYAALTQSCNDNPYDNLCSESFQLQQAALRDALLELYFTYFHVSHPFVAPLRFLKEKVTEDCPGLDVLINVLQFVGSLYAEDTASEPFETALLMHIPAENAIWGPFEVQAVLIYAVAVFWRNESDRARKLMDLCIRQAVSMGMHEREFATNYSHRDPVFAESWRRTWHEIYLCDAAMTATSRSATFMCSLRSLNPTVDLPCEESSYNEGIIPVPLTLEQYSNREFEDANETHFSSYAYLIGLIRSIDRHIIGVPPISEEIATNNCRNADASISAWLSLLPRWKRSCIRENGDTDYVILRAYMCIYIYTIDKHRYLSGLKFNPIESVSTCAPPPPPERLAPVYEREAHCHTKKILIAIAKMTELMTLPISLPKLSPFTVCMLASTIITHLSACRFILSGEELELARERIRVNIGTLENFSEVWSRATKTVKEVRIIAKHTLRDRTDGSTVSTSPSSAGASSHNGTASDTSGFSIPSMDYFQTDPNSISGFDPGFDPALASLFGTSIRETEDMNNVQ